MRKTCSQCTQQYEITDEDLEFLEKVSPVFAGKKYQIPVPALCPDCRVQRRIAFRNERRLYHRKCDLTGKEIISMYSPDKKIKVYDREVWWSDKWDPLSYGRDFDFRRPFFDQFRELLMAVPRIALNNKEPENSEFCNFCYRNKNSYLLMTSSYCESSFYANRSFYLKDSADCSSCNRCELCYELIDCDNCYNSKWLQNSSNCTDCSFGFNLKSCQNCFACCNLKNAKYCIENKQYTREEYEKKIIELGQDTARAGIGFEKLKKQAVRKYINGLNLENCSGDALFDSKNAHDCYESRNLQDCRYLYNTTNMKDAMDVSNDDNSELVYEAVGSESNYMHSFNDICWFNSDDYYNSLCFNSKNIFGCVGLKKNSYCILNKQYGKDQYQELVPGIIESMKKNGEWGEFFPVSLSLFNYNETLASEYFPLSREQAVKMGAKWKDEDATNRYQGPKIMIPDNIEDTGDEITKRILTCDRCSRNYKVVPQELALYRKLTIAVPKICPDCRHSGRQAKRNPRRLWDRQCAKCKTAIRTSYAPEQPETVYCESCYLKEIY
jgi:hypothetical protein